MKALIFLNGEPYKDKIDVGDSFVIACDGGYKFCLERGIKPDKVIGDFDSLGYTPNADEVYPVEKNFTDGEASVELLKKIDKVFSQVIFYNFGGGREDHFLGNLSVLIKASVCGYNAVAKTNNCDIFVVDSEIKIKNIKNNIVSIVPITENAHILESRGLKYTASGKTFCLDTTLGISNVACEDEIYLKLESGKILLFIVRS